MFFSICIPILFKLSSYFKGDMSAWDLVKAWHRTSPDPKRHGPVFYVLSLKLNKYMFLNPTFTERSKVLVCISPVPMQTDYVSPLLTQ